MNWELKNFVTNLNYKIWFLKFILINLKKFTLNLNLLAIYPFTTGFLKNWWDVKKHTLASKLVRKVRSQQKRALTAVAVAVEPLAAEEAVVVPVEALDAAEW